MTHSPKVKIPYSVTANAAEVNANNAAKLLNEARETVDRLQDLYYNAPTAENQDKLTAAREYVEQAYADYLKTVPASLRD